MPRSEGREHRAHWWQWVAISIAGLIVAAAIVLTPWAFFSVNHTTAQNQNAVLKILNQLKVDSNPATASNPKFIILCIENNSDIDSARIRHLHVPAVYPGCPELPKANS